MNHSRVVLTFLLLFFAWTSRALAEEQEVTKPALQVIRLKPGEQRFVEIALPHGEFRPAGKSGRSDFFVHYFPERPEGKFIPVDQGKPVKNEFFKAAPYPIAEGVTLRWSEDKPGIEFAANSNAPSGTKDIRVMYANFGFQGPHATAFRVIILSE